MRKVDVITLDGWYENINIIFITLSIIYRYAIFNQAVRYYIYIYISQTPIRKQLDAINLDAINIIVINIILYNYSLLLRSIRVFMDLKNDIHRSL